MPGWGFEHSSGSGSRLGVKPSCFCGRPTVFRGGSFDFVDEGVCFVLPQVGSEDFIGCNFFEWCTEEVIDSRNVVNVEDNSASVRNEEIGRSLMKMEERDVEKLKIGLFGEKCSYFGEKDKCFNGDGVCYMCL
ncbi:uncharacterized protein HKW66_Vig0111310 [Vigna angularis]|uniref:Uncharacterized protein n=1 Tax=Phaseolus angularis TaxID=3914 RepID=A0A8T0KXR8_PHAAN|nr:uncharacterized protein HKW66_Vig0111310 [Vigna angularis]